MGGGKVLNAVVFIPGDFVITLVAELPFSWVYIVSHCR